MKVQIKSKQDYGTHIDEVTEEIECELKKSNELIELKNDILHIIIEENKIVQNRYGNNITVEYQNTQINVLYAKTLMMIELQLMDSAKQNV